MKPDPREPAHHEPLLAIDPGRAGGAAWRDWTGTTYAVALPRALSATLDAVRDALASSGARVVLLEDVGLHRSGNSAGASAALARAVGQLEAAISCCGASIYWVPPKTWQGGVPFSSIPRGPGVPAHVKGAERQAIRNAHQKLRKRLIKELMQRQYPDCRVTLATADAIGILHWGVHSTHVRTTLETRNRLAGLNNGS